MTAQGSTGIGGDMEALKYGTLGLVNGAILLAVVAVILAAGSQTPQLIASFFSLLSWLVSQIITPVSGGSVVTIGTTLMPAGSYPSTGTTSSGGTGLIDTGTFGTGPTPVAASGTSAGTSSGTGSAAGIPFPASQLTCFVHVNGVLTEVPANPDGSCPAGT